MVFKTVLAIRGHHIYKSIREPETERYSQLKEGRQQFSQSIRCCSNGQSEFK